MLKKLFMFGTLVTSIGTALAICDCVLNSRDGDKIAFIQGLESTLVKTGKGLPIDTEKKCSSLCHNAKAKVTIESIFNKNSCSCVPAIGSRKLQGIPVIIEQNTPKACADKCSLLQKNLHDTETTVQGEFFGDKFI